MFSFTSNQSPEVSTHRDVLRFSRRGSCLLIKSAFFLKRCLQVRSQTLGDVKPGGTVSSRRHLVDIRVDALSFVSAI